MPSLTCGACRAVVVADGYDPRATCLHDFAPWQAHVDVCPDWQRAARKDAQRRDAWSHAEAARDLVRALEEALGAAQRAGDAQAQAALTRQRDRAVKRYDRLTDLARRLGA